LKLQACLNYPFFSGKLQALLGDSLNLLVLLMHPLLKLCMLLELYPLCFDEVSAQIHQLVPELSVLTQQVILFGLVVPRRITHLYRECLCLQSFLVVLFFRCRLVNEMLLLRAICDLIDELLLCGGQLDYLLVIEIEPPEIVLMLFK
jgi:hypothetical protein